MPDSNRDRSDPDLNRNYDTEKTKIAVEKIFRDNAVWVLFFLQFLAFVLIMYRWNRDAPDGEAASNVLALSLTTIEILLALLAIILGAGAFFGFWMIRRDAITAAEDAAVREVRRLDEEGYLSKREKKKKTKSTPRTKPDLAAATKEDSNT